MLRGAEPVITIDIECEALKDAFYIEDAIAPPFQNFNPIIEPFYKATIESFKKVVGDFVEPGLYRSQKPIKCLNSSLAHPLTPGTNGTLGSRFCVIPLKYLGQFLAQLIGFFELG